MKRKLSLSRWSNRLRYLIVGLLATLPAMSLAQDGKDSSSVLDRVSCVPALAPDQDRVLVSGQPNLTEGMVARYNRCLEWLLELKFEPDQSAKMRAMLVDDWTKAKAEDIKSDLDVLKLEEQTAPLKPEERDYVRSKLQPEVLKQLAAAKTNENSQWLLSLYNAANRPIAAGDPPLTRKMTDSMAELFCFIVAQAGGKQIAPDAAFKDAWSAMLSQKYSSFGKELKEQFTRAPELWPGVRLAWSRASEEEKNKLRAQWKQSLQASLPKDAASQAAERAAADLSALAKRDRNSLTPADLRKGADDLDLVAGALRREGGDNNLAQAAQAEQMARQFRAAAQNMVAANQPRDSKQAGKASSSESFDAAVARLQSQHARFNMMMNLNTMRHVSIMNMISTMGGSPYRYEIRYR